MKIKMRMWKLIGGDEYECGCCNDEEIKWMLWWWRDGRDENVDKERDVWTWICKEGRDE